MKTCYPILYIDVANHLIYDKKISILILVDKMKIARIYGKFSTPEKELALQKMAVDYGFYVTKIYKEKELESRPDKPALLRMISDLQKNDVIIAETFYLISRLPLSTAEKLVTSIREKKAKLAIPGLVDLSELAVESDSKFHSVLVSVQDLLLKLSLQIARDDYHLRYEKQRRGVQRAKKAGKYSGRKANTRIHKHIITLRQSGFTIGQTAVQAGCSISQVKRIWAMHKARKQSDK